MRATSDSAAHFEFRLTRYLYSPLRFVMIKHNLSVIGYPCIYAVGVCATACQDHVSFHLLLLILLGVTGGKDRVQPGQVASSFKHTGN